MKPVVHILANVIDEAAIEMSTLVFKTIRVGFPTSEVVVWGNGLDHEVVRAAAMSANCMRNPHCNFASHDDFIARRLADEHGRRVVFCDTDMVFYESVEDWDFDQPLAGMFEPKHRNPVTRAVHLPRLHTCLLWVKVSAFYDALEAWRKTLHPGPFTPLFVPWIQQWLPIGRDLHFADTGAIAYGAIGGQHFSEQQLNAFAHLQCGTWSKYVELHIPGLRESHRMAIDRPELFKGNWKTHNEWYERRQP